MAERDFRDRLQGDLSERYGALLRVVDEGLSARKVVGVSVTCKHCQKAGRYEVEVPDVKSALEAARFIAEHGYGRPGMAAAAADDERVIFVRVIGGTDAAVTLESAQELLPAERHEELLLLVASKQVAARRGSVGGGRDAATPDRDAEEHV